MLLTIDVGNTNTVLGVFDGAQLLVHWRLTTRREQTADEYGILVRNLFASSALAPSGIEAVALASVVPPLTPVLLALARQYLGHEPLVVARARHDDRVAVEDVADPLGGEPLAE